jgi:hypothetical protein
MTQTSGSEEERRWVRSVGNERQPATAMDAGLPSTGRRGGGEEGEGCAGLGHSHSYVLIPNESLGTYDQVHQYAHINLC